MLLKFQYPLIIWLIIILSFAFTPPTFSSHLLFSSQAEKLGELSPQLLSLKLLVAAEAYSSTFANNCQFRLFLACPPTISLGSFFQTTKSILSHAYYIQFFIPYFLL